MNQNLSFELNIQHTESTKTKGKKRLKIFIFVPVVILLALGALSIIKGIRGTWDQDVKPEDMVGPNNSFDSRDEPKDSDDD